MPEVQIEDRVLQHRLTEIESREQILFLIREIHQKNLWRNSGPKTFQSYLVKQFGYKAKEARDLCIAVGAIITTRELKASDPSEQKRIDLLRDWRRGVAKTEGIAAYRIFSNRTLLEIAKVHPLTYDSLPRIKGLGQKRIQAFGRELVSVGNPG